MSGRTVVVECAQHLPAGLLSWPAWQVLHSGEVSTGDPDHRQLPALRAAGVEVTVETPTAEELLSRAEAGRAVVWLSSGAHDADLVRELQASGPAVEVLQASVDPPGARLLDVVAVMDRLRSPGGCPWDAEQTHASLMPYLLEEAYEAYAALEEGDGTALREELGDVLLQVVFHARLAQEADSAWSVDDVAGDLVDKLVRRHPHVFAGASADDLEGSWEALKQAEKGRTSVTDGVPLSQPALWLAAKLQRRAERLGAPAGVYDGLGGELWALVQRCRADGVDPEVALRTTARTFRDRLAAAEQRLLAEGRDPATVEPAEWLDLLTERAAGTSAVGGLVLDSVLARVERDFGAPELGIGPVRFITYGEWMTDAPQVELDVADGPVLVKVGRAFPVDLDDGPEAALVTIADKLQDDVMDELHRPWPQVGDGELVVLEPVLDETGLAVWASRDRRVRIPIGYLSSSLGAVGQLR